MTFVRLSVLLVLLLCGMASNAFAAAPPHEVKNSVVAIVDVQRLMQASKAARSVQDQLEGQRSKFQTEVAGEEKELREAEQQLAKLRETAKPEEFAEQEQKLQQRFMVVERHVQSKRKALDQTYTDSMNTVRKGIVDIVSEIAKEKGVNLVVVKQQVIWNDGNVDITDEVLSRLDKKLPQIQVKIISEEELASDPPLVVKSKAKDPKRDEGSNLRKK